MFTIAHISDLHFGREDPLVAAGLAQDIKSLRPDLIAVSGDLTERARPKEFQKVSEFLSQFHSPRIVVPGNHDIPLLNLFRRFLNPFASYETYFSSEYFPTFQNDEVFVLGLNSVQPLSWRTGRLGSSHLKELRDRVKRVPKHLFKILVTHHPLVPTRLRRSENLMAQRSRAVGVFEELNIDLVLTGHLHRGVFQDVREHFSQVTRKILMAQAGTAVSRHHRGEPNTYNLITLENDRLHVSIRSWHKSKFERDWSQTFHHENGVWH